MLEYLDHITVRISPVPNIITEKIKISQTLYLVSALHENLYIFTSYVVFVDLFFNVFRFCEYN